MRVYQCQNSHITSGIMFIVQRHSEGLAMFSIRQNALKTLLLAHRKTLRFLSIECYCSYCAESARYFQLHSFFITYYTFLISILCTTLRMSVFNKELLTYLLTSMYEWSPISKSPVFSELAAHFFFKDCMVVIALGPWLQPCMGYIRSTRRRCFNASLRLVCLGAQPR